MDKNKPMEFIKYLEWNKEIHKRGLKRNCVAISVTILLLFLGISTFTIPILIINLFDCFINLECINIQNYNIYRFKEKEDTLRKYTEKVNKRNLDKYGKAIESINESLNKSEQIPSVLDVIRNMTTKEQLQQLRAMALEFLKQREQIEDVIPSNQEAKTR